VSNGLLVYLRAYNKIVVLHRVLHTIELHRMFRPGDRVAIAVSGGADSVCLLHVLTELAPRLELSLSVVHVNHNLRKESGADADFVARLAAQLNLEFALHNLDLSGVCGNLEQAARHARLACFHDHLSSGRAARVALGHTRSDQAETVLFRLLRGSGCTGLAAIRPVTAGGIVRPLLDIERVEIVRFLRERGICWREDATNATLDFARNRIRHQLLPQLTAEWNPGLTERLAHTADVSVAEEAYWEAEIGRLAGLHLTHRGGACFLSASLVRGLALAVARRLVRHAIQMASGGRVGDFHQVGGVLELARRSRGDGRIQLAGVEVRRSFDWLRFGTFSEPEAYCCRPAIPGVTRVPGTEFAISLEMHEKEETTGSPGNVYNSGVVGIDWNRLSGPLQLRNWQPGDQYQPRGVPAAKKIKTLFQEARIPVWERAQWPVLTDAESIVWTRRFGTAAAAAADSGSSRILAVNELEVR
jgi:tRNA(Ile)-lysidine synthase